MITPFTFKSINPAAIQNDYSYEIKLFGKVCGMIKQIENGTADVRVRPNGNDYIACVFKGFDPINSCWQQVEAKDSFYFGISLRPVVLGEHYVLTVSQDVPFQIFWNTSAPPGGPLVVITTYDESQKLIEGYFVKDILGMVYNCSGEQM